MFAVLIIGAFVYVANHPDELAKLKEADWRMTGPILLLSVVSSLCAAFGYCALMRRADSSLQRGLIIRHFIIGRTLNLVAPQGGSIYRAVALKQHANLSYGIYAVSMAAYIWIELMITAALLILCLVVTNHLTQHAELFTAAICFLALGAFARPILSQIGRVAGKIKWLPAASKFKTAAESLQFLVSHPRLIAEMTIFASVNAVSQASRLMICFSMIDYPLLFWQAVVITLAFKAANSFMITPGNFGVVEGITALAAKAFGAPIALSIIAGLIYRVTAYLALFLMSLACVLLPNRARPKINDLHNKQA